MRRSAAPSQLASASKRPCFTPPFAIKPLSNLVHISVIDVCKQQKPADGSVPSHNPETPPSDQSASSVLPLIQQGREPVRKLPSNHQDKTCKHDGPTPTLSRCQNSCTDSNTIESTEKENSSSSEDANPTQTVENLQLCSTLDSKSGNLTVLTNDAAPPTTSDSGPSKLEVSKITTQKSHGLKPRISFGHRGMFRQPTKTVSPKTLATDDSPMEVLSRHFSVVWCKLSKKKHKKWEGDAILVTKGKSVVLLDTDGKEIGKGSGYKTSELSSMSEGHSLCIGGKEIEVMGMISADDFSSGKCFQTSSSSAPSASPSVPHRTKVPVKPFTNPQRNDAFSSGDIGIIPPLKLKPKPLHDSSLPDALVMPRPSSAHQWAHNPQHHPIVDVVVDPYLASRLRPHQREGVLFLYECVMGMRGFQGNGAILADDMGLGKTLQCISLLWTLFKQGPYRGKPIIKRILIVTPGSLVKNWFREFKKWLGTERMQVFAVSTDKKVQEFSNSIIYPVLIISYEMFVRSIDDVRKIKFDLIVCDEGHRLKNTNIKTTLLISSLPVKRRIILTGTPVQNDLQEFHSIVEFCNPGVLGSSTAFHRVYEDPITKGNQPQATTQEKALSATRAAELSRLTGLFVLRRTQEINNQYLPPKVESVIFCKPSHFQLGLYGKMLRSRLLRSCLTSSSSLSDGSLTTSTPHLVCITALKKLCNHPALLHEACLGVAKQQQQQQRGMEEHMQEESLYNDLLPLYPEDFTVDDLKAEHSGKMQVLASMLHSMHQDGSSAEKIVLVSNYTQTLSLLQKLCEQEGYGFCRLDGTTPTARRLEIVEHFNSSHARETVFLLSSKAGGVGLNLIGASRLLLYDIDWNPANDLQAMARVWRDGQKKQVHIYRLITTGTIEEKVYQRQISKQGLSGAIVDAKNHGHVKFSLEDLKNLFTLHESASSITHDMMGCGCYSGQMNLDIVETGQARACQLGVQSGQDKKNLSMNQLMEWKHFLGPLEGTFEDKHLLSAGEQVTFVFQNKINMKPTANV